MRVTRRPLPPSKPWGVRAAAEAILTRLEQSDAQVPLQGLRDLVEDRWSSAKVGLDLRMSDVAAAAAIAITQISEPVPVVDDVITDFAVAFRKKPEDIRDKVAAASHDLFVGTLPIADQLKVSPAKERMHDLEQLAQEVAQRNNDAQWGEPLVQHFVARYRELLGIGILRAAEIKDLFYSG